MRKAIGIMAILLTAAAGAAPHHEEDAPKAEQGAGSAAMEEMMAEWMKYSTPGPEHEHFKKAVGTWKTTGRMWMEPGADPVESKGSAVFRLIFDGRFLQQEYRGEWMGSPFTGISIEGFDRFRKQHVSVWIDSMSTLMFVSRGSCDEDGTACTYLAEMDDPMSGQLGRPVKSTMRWTDENTMVFEMYDMRGADWFRHMELVYRRAR
jgi:hypothetical protein